MSRSWCKQSFESYRWVPDNAAVTGTFNLKIVLGRSIISCLPVRLTWNVRQGWWYFTWHFSSEIFPGVVEIFPEDSLYSLPSCICEEEMLAEYRIFGLLTYPPTFVLILCWSLLTLWNEQGAWHPKYPTSLNVCAVVQSRQLIQLNMGNTSTSSWLEKTALIRIQCYQCQTDTTSLSYTIHFCNVILVLESGSWKLAAFDVTEFKDVGIILSVRSELLSAHLNVFPRIC